MRKRSDDLTATPPSSALPGHKRSALLGMHSLLINAVMRWIAAFSACNRYVLPASGEWVMSLCDTHKACK